ncbi:MAG: HlyD family efflux transporter periplasmic adaptor subunit [Mogibacterium diversum]|nr:HlyD family efflux transporter periplasmic adaptor subunit [Mogibacterium diversum]
MDQQVVNADTLKDTGYTDKEIENAKINNEKIKGQIKYEAINNAANSRKQYEQENSTIDSQIQAMEKRKENYTIKATSSGRLHMLDMYKPGMTVQAGAPIASISNMGKATAIIDATISASDRSRIRVGNNVSILVLGLQQNVYGTLKGKVVEIDSDISISNDGKKSFFKIKIEPDSIVLNPKDGKIVELKNGMAVEARIIYNKITYFDYAMNAIGIKDRIN